MSKAKPMRFVKQGEAFRSCLMTDSKEILKASADTYVPCSVDEATHVHLCMPGPMPYRILPVITRGTRRGTNCWSWNGNTEKPTLKPSIRSKSGDTICHTFVNDGMVRFLDDCSHEFADQTLELLDVEDE